MKMRITIAAMLLLCISALNAQIVPNALFSKNAVLQQGVKIPVFGTAPDNESVTVQINKQKVTTVTKDGVWQLLLKPIKAGGPYTMTITGKNNQITIDSIYVGEVWLAGGQSNMERQLGPRNGQQVLVDWLKEKAAANFPLIRMYTVPHITATEPSKNVVSKWEVCDTNTVVNFSAVAYFFARNLHQHLKVPVGIIHSSWGGTPAEKWISKSALSANDELSKIVTDYEKSIVDFPARLADFNLKKDSLIARWKLDTALAKQNKKPLPPMPSAPKDPKLSGNCGGLFNAMIAPLIPYAMKGVIWYQGEANRNNAKLYKTLFPALIKDWRTRWNLGDFPFLFAQIAPFKAGTPEIREAQLYTSLTVTNTAMAGTMDCGDCNDIHPTNKLPVGNRLALAARALAYNEKKLLYSGPVVDKVKIDNDKVIVSFNFAGDGLKISNPAANSFMIAGEDKQFVAAEIAVEKDKIIFSNKAIAKPAFVRYAWENCPTAVLFNSDGLPASSFRTDEQSN